MCLSLLSHISEIIASSKIIVAKTCLKEYTGIECEGIISLYENIHDIILDYKIYDELREDKLSHSIPCKTVKEYLQRCIELINTIGYNKYDTKCIAYENKDNKITVTERSITESQKVIDYFCNNNFNSFQTFLYNIQTVLRNKYTEKPSGFIAYAYLAYQKEIEKQEVKKTKNKSTFQGTIIAIVKNNSCKK